MSVVPARAIRLRSSRENLIAQALIILLAAWLTLTVLFPLSALLSKSFRDVSGAFVGFANYAAYFSNHTLAASIGNSLAIALATTAITVPLAYVYAYALTRSAMHGKTVFRALALIPILAPSLLPALSLIYLFGNQGLLKGLLFGHTIYGPLGVVAAEVFHCFPHALMILVTALTLADQRLYEVAQSLGTSKPRTFLTITLPGSKYGLMSAAFVVFTLTITDFGAPKVIGGNFDVLATDIYKQVIGQQNFEIGAVVGMVLIIPALLAFIVDRAVQRRQVALLSARAVPYAPRPAPLFDWTMFAFCGVIALVITGVLAVAAFGSLVKFWPYNLELTLANYEFARHDADGWSSYWNSLRMAGWTAVTGTVLVFCGAYLIEKTRGSPALRAIAHMLALLPLAVPGLVLGLGYIFFFNHPDNPLVFLYGTLAILVVNTTAHFYTVCHLTAVTALKQLDAEFEAVSASLKVPFWRTFRRVTVPLCLPAILDISVYLFVNAMTTVSSVIFLYSAETKLAAVAVVNMDDASKTAPAAAMAMMIFYTSAALRMVHAALTRGVMRRTQAWRRQ